VNKSYISVWNETLGAWVAASEVVATRGKKASKGAVLRSQPQGGTDGAVRSGVGRSVLALAMAGVVGFMGWLPVAHAQYQAGSGAQAVAAHDTAVGDGAYANSKNSPGTAVADYATALGYNAAAYGGSAVALGNGAQAGTSALQNQHTYATAVGTMASALALQTTALGAYSIADQDNAMSLGAYSQAHGVSGLALGTQAVVNAGATNSVAIGTGATVAADVSNAIALGANSVATRANTVSVGAVGAERQVVNVAAGSVSSTSTDAVNGSQLYKASNSVAAALGGDSTVNTDGTVSAPSYAVGGTTATSVGAAITNLDGRTTTNATNIATNTTDITNLTNNLNSGSVGLVKQDATTHAIAVAADKAGTSVDFTGTEGARTLSGVKDGTLAAGSTEAVNGSQMYTTNQNVAANTANIATNTTAITNLDGRTTTNTTNIATNTTDITKLTNNLNGGSVGLVKQDATTHAITVAADKAGMSVDFTGTEGARTLSGVKDGTLAAGSTEAVNGGQLFTTNQNVAANTASIATNTTNIAGNTTAIANLDGRVTSNTGDIADLKNGASGLVQQDAATRTITVAKDTDGASVDFTGTAGARTLTGVAAGAVHASSLDAINGSQLHGVSSSVASALGGGSTVNPNGTVSAPSYNVGGTTVRNVGDAVTNLDGRVATHTQQIAELNDTLNSGSEGLVQQDATTRAITVAKGTDGTSVDFTGTAGARTLTGVAAGAVHASSLDAINGSQLHGVSSSVASALGGGSMVDADGKVTAPTYTVNNATYSSVNDALQGLAGSVKDAGSHVTVVEKVTSTGQANAQVATSGGADQAAAATGSQAVAIGAGATASANNSVALGAGSVANRDNTVSVGSAGNERAIANVADGVVATDAVNKRQLDTVADSTRAYTDQRLNQVQSEVESVKRDANAAAASSMAVATLPQSVIPGRGMASAALSNMGGESALAVGVSKVAENGRWVTKLAGTVNTRGNAGVSAGIGFHW
jgi:autotransporter adhesin